MSIALESHLLSLAPELYWPMNDPLANLAESIAGGNGNAVAAGAVADYQTSVLSGGTHGVKTEAASYWVSGNNQVYSSTLCIVFAYKHDSTDATYQPIIHFGDLSPSPNWGWWLLHRPDQSGQLQFGTIDAPFGSFQAANSTVGTSSDTAHIIAINVVPNIGIEFWVDGVLQGGAAVPFPYSVHNPTSSKRQYAICTRDGNGYETPGTFDIAHMAIFHRNLSQAEITTLTGIGLAQSFGEIAGSVLLDGVAAERDIIALTYNKDGAGDREVVGQARSDANGDYTISTGNNFNECIVIALEDYGQEWQANIPLAQGDRVRPTLLNQNGHVYTVTTAGDSGSTEPTWLLPGQGGDTQAIGAAVADAEPLYWSLVHAPVTPEAI